MAKTKKTKKSIKLTNDELDKLQKIVNGLNNYNIQIGRHEMQKHQVMHMAAGLNDELTVLRNSLKEKYGTDDINILDGTINK
tara:strand:+ start:1170 stop:1415 length:246 start_codon:yes stop_codon:yes gene_type:complete